MMEDSTIQYILNNSEIDSVSNVSFATVVFMLYYGLELDHFLTDISDELVQRYDLVKHDVGEHSIYRSGSVAQGFYLNTNYLPHARDIDVVAICHRYDIREKCEYDEERYDITGVGDVSDIRVKLHDEDAKQSEDTCPMALSCDDEEKYFNIKVLSDTPPGYVLIERCKRQRKAIQTESERYVSSLKATEARVKFWSDLQPMIKQKFDGIDPNDEGKESALFSFFQPHGPAATAFMSLFESTTPFETDLVFCVPYPLPWPRVAAEFLTRERPSGWPSQTLINEIYNDGCTLIPKGEVGSKMEDYEWRISFTGELRLARALSKSQRDLVHALKALISEPQHPVDLLDVSTSVESYHLLTLMYRESENVDTSFWAPSNIAKTLFLLLDRYVEHFEKRFLSHYFISQRNVFAKYTSLTAEEIDTVLYTVLRIRHDPIGQILQQEKYLNLPPGLHRWAFGPIVDGLSMGNTRQINPICYVKSLLRLSKAHLQEGHLDRAMVFASDAKRFLDFMQMKDTLVHDIADVNLILLITMHRAGHLDKAIAILEYLGGILRDEEDNVDAMSLSLFYQLEGRLSSVLYAKKEYMRKECVARIWSSYKKAIVYTSCTKQVVVEFMYVVIALFGPDEFKRKTLDIKEFLPTTFEDVEKSEDVEILYDRKQLTAKMEVDVSVGSIAPNQASMKQNKQMEFDNGNSVESDVQCDFSGTEKLQTTFDIDTQTEQDISVTVDNGESDVDQNPEASMIDSYTVDDNGVQEDTEADIQRSQTFYLENPEHKFTSFNNQQNLKVVDYSSTGHIRHTTQPDMNDQKSTKMDVEDTVMEEVIYDRKTFRLQEHPEVHEFREENNIRTLDDDDNLKYSDADVKMIDVKFVEDFCRVKLFERIGLVRKSEEIMARLKANVRKARQTGMKVSIKMVEQAYDEFFNAAKAMTDVSPHISDIDITDNNYIYFSRADSPYLDEIFHEVFSKVELAVMKVPVNMVLLHSKIMFFSSRKMVRELRELMEKMETFVDSLEEKDDIEVCERILNLHRRILTERFEGDFSFDVGLDEDNYMKELPVKDQVLKWIDAVFDTMTKYEPKNKYLDEVFHNF